jgi:hypothetical protein
LWTFTLAGQLLAKHQRGEILESSTLVSHLPTCIAMWNGGRPLSLPPRSTYRGWRGRPQATGMGFHQSSQSDDCFAFTAVCGSLAQVNYQESCSSSLSAFCCCCCCCFAVLGFELRAYTLSHCTSPFSVMGIFKIGSHKLFSQAGFELQSS